MLLFNGSNSSNSPAEAEAAFHFSVMLHLFSMISLIVNNYVRGTRVQMYPLIMGFALYSLAFFFGIFEELAYYYYYLTVLVSIIITYFFGSTDFYSSFEPSGGFGTDQHAVGCVIT